MSYSRPEPLRAEHVLEGFECGERSLDIWLERFARHAEATRSARTFVVVTGEADIAAYYALTVGEVSPVDATPRMRKGQPQGATVPVAVLARLAVDRRHQRRGLGRSLLQDALLRVHGAAEALGIRALVAHAVSEGAADFYVRFGFERSPADERLVVLLMKDLGRLIDG